jgi:hypothetical protein
VRGDDGLIPIRSYSVCFQLERRIHKIDRWRVPLSYGVPLAAVGWAAGVLLATLVLARLPILGAVLGALHPALRLVILPVAAAAFLSRWRIDGRRPLPAAVAYVRWRATPRHLAGFRAQPQRLELGTVTFAGDGRGARLRDAVIRGPARVVLRYPAALKQRGARLHVTAHQGEPQWRGKEITIQPGQRVVVHG